MHKWTNSLRVTKFGPQIIKFLYYIFSITDKTQLKWHQLYETRNSKEGMAQTLVWKWTFNVCVKQLLIEHNNIIIFTVISEYYCFIKKIWTFYYKLIVNFSLQILLPVENLNSTSCYVTGIFFFHFSFLRALEICLNIFWTIILTCLTDVIVNLHMTRKPNIIYNIITTLCLLPVSYYFSRGVGVL